MVQLSDSRSYLMHSQYQLSVLEWHPGPARKNDTQIILAACGRFHAVIFQEAGDHVPHISQNFYTYTDGNDLAILLDKDTFVSGSAVFPISEASTSKDTWRFTALVVRGLLRHLSIADSPTITFCSVHLHNKVATKRDASTSLLLHLREHMINHSVDFIGGDFNMSAFSTVGDVFSDPEFVAPGNSLLWGFGGLDETLSRERDCSRFVACGPVRHESPSCILNSA